MGPGTALDERRCPAFLFPPEQDVFVALGGRPAQGENDRLGSSDLNSFHLGACQHRTTARNAAGEPAYEKKVEFRDLGVPMIDGDDRARRHSANSLAGSPPAFSTGGVRQFEMDVAVRFRLHLHHLPCHFVPLLLCRRAASYPLGRPPAATRTFPRE